jgi:hypothetical protein
LRSKGYIRKLCCTQTLIFKPLNDQGLADTFSAGNLYDSFPIE